MSNLTAQAARVERPGWLRVPFQRAAVASHDIVAALPARLQAAVPGNYWEARFRQALVPEFLYPTLADSEPFQGKIGQKKTFTRAGVMTPDPTPLAAGADTTNGSYNIEQWTVELATYGKSLPTDMLTSNVELASQYAQDVTALGTHAGQTLNQVARNRLYDAYGGGRTYVRTTATSDSSVLVSSVTGFGFVSVNGVLTPVSPTNPLAVVIYPAGGGAGVANTVTGVNTGTNALTLGTARADTVGDSIVAANAPTTIRPTGNTIFDLSGANIVTLDMFLSAVGRLREMSVPDVDGYYVAHIDPVTELQLFRDADFKSLHSGRFDSPIFQGLSLGRFAGIDWVRNNQAPTVMGGAHASGGTAGTVKIRRPIVLGQGALIAAPLEGQGALLDGTGVQDIPNISMVEVSPGVEVSMIVKPPTDNLQRQLVTSWAWTGDYGVPTDLYAAAGDAALYKRAVVIEHAG